MDPARGARLIFNDRLNTVVALIFVAVTLAVVLSSLREWWLILRGHKQPRLAEAPIVESAYAG
jgi:carbon starvation protein